MTVVGVKSHRAKGKRLTTYEVAALRFIEPELPSQPEPEPADEEPEVAGAGSDEEFDAAASSVEDMDVAGGASVSEEVAFEIERPGGDAEEAIDPEQLDLF